MINQQTHWLRSLPSADPLASSMSKFPRYFEFGSLHWKISKRSTAARTGCRFIVSKADALSNPMIKRSAFTLLELLLALALLAAFAAVSIPAIMNTLKSQRLQYAAQQLQADFSRGRIEAMESGRIRMMRFQVDNGKYVIQPYLQGNDALESNLVGVGGGMPGGGANTANFSMQSAEQEIRNEVLPEGVVFAGNEVKASMRGFQLEQEAGQTMMMSEIRPILFYPDGSTSDAKVFLKSEDDTILSVKLRGLTGVARVEEVSASMGGTGP
ncbi:MAG: prepilin-type N-terminal cleavage/methylation domain-containing protein [Pirellulaceae bacterium]